MKNLKELKIWQKGIEMVVDIYKTSKSFSQEEQKMITGLQRSINNRN
jgi:hypothetical protein